MMFVVYSFGLRLAYFNSASNYYSKFSLWLTNLRMGVGPALVGPQYLFLLVLYPVNLNCKMFLQGVFLPSEGPIRLLII